MTVHRGSPGDILDAIEAYLLADRSRLEQNLMLFAVWSEQWDETWGSLQTVNKALSIIGSGSWDGKYEDE